MKYVFRYFQTVTSLLLGFMSMFTGGVDGLLAALLVMMAVDYFSGVLRAIHDHNLNSKVGFIGLARKVLIFVLVGVGNVLDMYVLGTPGMLRTAVILFYMANEGLSILENTASIGLPIPDQLRETLEQLHEHKETGHENHAHV